jgi:S-disulfanyl-L-cysteine oxidoreductase SoxD
VNRNGKVYAALAALICLSGASVGKAQAPSRSVWEGVYTNDQAKRGQQLYAQHCGSCHGDTLGGGESAPALAGAEFLSNWNGLTVGDLFDRMRTSMPQDKPGKLSREQNADILAHMFRANEFPAGSVELNRNSEMLKQIRIDAMKPETKK